VPFERQAPGAQGIFTNLVVSVRHKFSEVTFTNRAFHIIPFISILTNYPEKITQPDHVFSGNGVEGKFNESFHQLLLIFRPQK
jgi:hypothetical protein